MNEPQDYEAPTQVSDPIAENGIRRGVTVSQATLVVLMALVGVVGYFGDRFVTQVDLGFDNVGGTLIEIRSEISLIRTGSLLNKNEISLVRKQVDLNTTRLDINTKSLMSRAHRRFNQPDAVMLCEGLESLNEGLVCPKIKHTVVR